MLTKYKTIHQYITTAGYYSQYTYPSIKTHNDDDEVRKLALIVNNEFLYIDHKKGNPYFHIRLPESITGLSMADAVSILEHSLDLFITRPDVADTILTGHNSRLFGHKSERYKKWKETIKFIFSDHQYCFKCGKVENGLHVDHIKSHNSFRDLKRAYNLGNGQMLCCACNLAKNPDDATDYRTLQHLLLVRDFINETGVKIIQ